MSGGDPAAPVTNNYSDTMEESLEAQIKLAPDLFKAESNNEYGRPAYARLMQNITMEGLLGKELTYDSEGRIVTGYSGGDQGRYSVINDPSLSSEKGSTYVANKGFRSSGGKTHVTSVEKLSNNFKIIDNQTGEMVDTGDTTFSDIDSALSYVRDDLGGGMLTPTYKTDADGNVIRRKEMAGKTTRAGGGVVDLIAGTDTYAFSDGATRRAGFDENGNFLGTARLEQDILERIKDRNARTEIGLVENYGERLTDAYRAQGGIQESLDNYNKLVEQGTDHGGLRTELINQAQEELALGSALSDRETRNIQQASRAASTARGRGRDFSAVLDEVANNDMFSRQRLNDRRTFASQAIGIADQGKQMDQAFAAQRIGLEQATSADPFLALTGRASGASVGAGQNLYGNAAAGIGAGPTLFNPAQGAEFMANQSAMINNYNASIYGAQQARSGAIIGGALGAVGSIGGGYLSGNCWVAREVYGVHNPAWLVFRHWMLFLSPFWFRAIYLNFGERFAKFIRNKPRLKARIRAWMDTKVKEVI